METFFALLLLTQLPLSDLPQPTPADYEPTAIPQYPDYVNILQIPAYSAGASHCEEDPYRPGKYKFHPEFLSRMGAQYPRVLFDGHLLVWSRAHNAYHFGPRLASGESDPLAGKVARWSEEQDFNTKHTTRKLAIPGGTKKSVLPALHGDRDATER